MVGFHSLVFVCLVVSDSQLAGKLCALSMKSIPRPSLTPERDWEPHRGWNSYWRGSEAKNRRSKSMKFIDLDDNWVSKLYFSKNMMENRLIRK